MAQNQQTIACEPGVWTQLTNADATAITLEVVEGKAMFRFTANETAPTESFGITYSEEKGELQKDISAMTYLNGAVRVWAKPKFGKRCLVYVDHA